MKSSFITFLLLLVLSLFPVSPVEAKSFCRLLSDRTICILSIQRSAKNYWEYRAAVSVNGVARPIEIYNCRDRLRVRQNGKVVPFKPEGVGEVICSLMQR
ncbi:hypothetical protein H6F90_02395 [Trichocoleus sp. FACHB-591]|uniref:hypothetical protein n=1 Tax=Trichocoleus sp. FACHB-591 TaxID=2692872 RepID=UPI0016892B89|nr:hypothetical protein [Trichocoleus sp. FACHB-591]MBD2094007.1 hypothetical protein [Trichocoleus sp. FACHB-591]